MSASSIPKRIIQTGKSAQLPLRERAMVNSLRALHPDYEYLFFDDTQVEQFIDDVFPQYRPVFDGFPYRIQKYDFFRYLAVFHYGGFYFDLDVLLAERLDSLHDDACVFPFEGLTMSRYLRGQGMDWQIGNYAFGAAAGQSLLQTIIENCVRAQREPDWVKPMMNGVPPLSRAEFTVLNSSGPGLISRTLMENKSSLPGVKVLFQDDVCDVTTWNRFGTLGVHMMDGSWRGKTSFIRRRITQRWEVWQMERLMRESRKLGPTRWL
jgi:hypothetical protein